MPPSRQQPQVEAERRRLRERRRVVRAEGLSDSLLLLLAKLLAVLTGTFVGLFSAYIISFFFVNQLEGYAKSTESAIASKQNEIQTFQPELTRAQAVYDRLLKLHRTDSGAGPAAPATETELPLAGGEAPTLELPPPALPSASGASPELTAAARALDAATTYMRSLQSRLTSLEQDLADYQRTIFITNLLSAAVVLVMALLGYLLYPVYYVRLERSAAHWSALFAQRSLRTGPLLIGFMAGLVLAVLVLLAIFTTISMDYGILKLPPFRLAFGAIVSVCLGMAGALIGASYFSPPPPEKDPYEEYRRQAAPNLLDSSVLIDGRVYEVAANGFLQGVLTIPTSVLDELRTLADSGDERKRLKGRRGLDMVNKLKADSRLDVMVLDDKNLDSQARGADEHLLALATLMSANVVTNDSNLNRVAAARDVRVINLHALANAVKTNLLPGDFLELDITDRGKQRGQGVGYLPDGTMVVVEDGEPCIGMVKTIKLTSISQTQAGRLLFGRVDLAEGRGQSANGHTPGNSHSGGGR